jgi:hypothetical protein
LQKDKKDKRKIRYDKKREIFYGKRTSIFEDESNVIKGKERPSKLSEKKIRS